jgi:hypothetical protein
MTDTELDRLDRLAAVHVMGYKFDSELRVWLTSDDKYVTNDWCPTHYIEQAWELLEKLKGTSITPDEHSAPHKILSLCVNCYDDDPRGMVYCCTISACGLYFEADHEDTAPLAIVKACLLAVGINPNSAGVEATGVSLGESND